MTQIRAAGPDDVPVLVELMAAFYNEGGYRLPRAAGTRAFQSLLADPALGRVWLIERDGVAVGIRRGASMSALVSHRTGGCF